MQSLRRLITTRRPMILVAALAAISLPLMWIAAPSPSSRVVGSEARADDRSRGFIEERLAIPPAPQPRPDRAGSVDDARAPIAVRIVPKTYREKVGGTIEEAERSIDIYPPAHFHVVVTNVSDQPIRLWREQYSHGYSCLSFEISDEKGGTFSVRKKPRNWRKNLADWMIIPRGDHMVFDVSFDEAIWQGAPPPSPSPVLVDKPRVLRMKAVYEVRPDPQAERFKVWVGKVASPEEAYNTYR